MSCSKKGDESSCVYSTGRANRRDRHGREPRDSEAQLRLQKLEEMITSLMCSTKEISEDRRDTLALQNGNANQPFNNYLPKGSDLSPELQLSTNIPERDYVSTTHWTAILENVCIPSARTFSIYS